MSGDPYGLIASGLPPELAAQLVGLQGRQQIAQALMQQSLEPLQQPVNKGELQSVTSPFAALAKVLQAPLARMQSDSVQKGYADLASEAVKQRGRALQDYQTQRDGAPATPPLTPNDDEGNAMPPVAGSPGNARAAIMQAMLNPMLASNPVVQADLKKMEPNWKVEESFNQQTGRKEKMLVNLNDPTQRVPFGGQERAHMQAIEAAGPDGRPVTRFVDPNATTTDIAKPVKKEMQNTGKAIVPVDPYAATPLAVTTSPNADQSAGVAIRGQNIHRQTSLQVAGLDANGMPTGDIKDVAKGIAEYRMAPLSSFALGHPRGQAIMGEVLRENPDYDAKDYATSQAALTAFAKGKQGDTVRSLSVAVDHIGTAKQAITALQSGDVPLFNKLSQTLARQTGKPAPATFDAIRDILSDEVTKAVLGGAGGVADREKTKQTMATANSPQQLLGVLGGYEDLMRGQLGGLRRQYEQTTKRKDFDKFLSEQARQEIGGAAPAGNSVLDQADAILRGGQ